MALLPRVEVLDDSGVEFDESVELDAMRLNWEVACEVHARAQAALGLVILLALKRKAWQAVCTASSVSSANWVTNRSSRRALRA
jgi:hypothetical protein